MNDTIKTTSTWILAAVTPFGITLGLSLALFTPEDSDAQALCARSIQRFEQYGRGDKDSDGLTTCEEKFITFTNGKDWDTDDDGISDGDEASGSTDPLDADSDDDGIEDGDEDDLGTSPVDPDSDNDGSLDGEDDDPADDLAEEIEGPVDALACPTADVDGAITVLGIDVVLNAATTYDGAEDCAALAQRILDFGGAHVEVRVTDDGLGTMTATRVDLEDADNDGSPDKVDDDDDNDGIDDVDDDDDDDDGVPDGDDHDDDDGDDEDDDDDQFEDEDENEDDGDDNSEDDDSDD